MPDIFDTIPPLPSQESIEGSHETNDGSQAQSVFHVPFSPSQVDPPLSLLFFQPPSQPDGSGGGRQDSRETNDGTQVQSFLPIPPLFRSWGDELVDVNSRGMSDGGGGGGGGGAAAEDPSAHPFLDF